jgi:hypothetical protein
MDNIGCKTDLNFQEFDNDLGHVGGKFLCFELACYVSRETSSATVYEIDILH